MHQTQDVFAKHIWLLCTTINQSFLCAMVLVDAQDLECTDLSEGAASSLS